MPSFLLLCPLRIKYIYMHNIISLHRVTKQYSLATITFNLPSVHYNPACRHPLIVQYNTNIMTYGLKTKTVPKQTQLLGDQNQSNS